MSSLSVYINLTTSVGLIMRIKIRIVWVELGASLQCGTWWRIGRVDAFRPKSHGFDSRSNRHAGTLSKSFTHSCLWRFGVNFRHSIHAVSGAPLSSSGVEEALYK